MASITIGVYIDVEPARLQATLGSLRVHSLRACEVLLLGDGPDDETAATLRQLELPQSNTEAPSGAPACFNRLLRHAKSDYYLFLESGAIVTRGWLDALMAAFQRYPRCGLAGPSTNRAWNEQCIFPTAIDSPEEIARLADLAARRFGATCRTLEPLHSLSDFCYMLRRETVETVGEADASYGFGPCWEMDYNLRAARRGFQGLWACGAYVHRPPFTARRQHQEAVYFEASKRRYQDKFCGLRLRGLKSDYRQHCRGEACTNFAPSHLIGADAATEVTAPAVPESRSAAVVTEWPLVSCIMPTYNRRLFIPRALRCFFNQDYPKLELLVVDDGTDPISDMLPKDARIRYWRLPEKLTVGAKRNYACASAQGSVIVHWDDDDWHSPSRVRRQIAPLLDAKPQVSGTSTVYYYNHGTNQAFRYQYHGPVLAWLYGLAYPKWVWERHPFEPIQVAEDVRFIANTAPDARFDINDPAISVAAIHSCNASAKVTTGSFWTSESAANVRALMGADADLPGPAPVVEQYPLVSCIMPTYNRRPFIALSLGCFQRQTYPRSELVTVDDGSDPVGDLLEGIPNVRYIRVNQRMSIGAKRNLACEQAGGEFIAHWDDDDWYSPERLARQVEPLRANTHDLTGLVNSYVLQMPSGQFWTISDAVHSRMFVGDMHGGTLVYRRQLWLNGIRYPEVNLAEDAMLVRRAAEARKRMLRLGNPGIFVYLRHGANTWKFDTGRFLDPAGWMSACAPPGFTPEIMQAYRAACAAAAV